MLHRISFSNVVLISIFLFLKLIEAIERSDLLVYYENLDLITSLTIMKYLVKRKNI